MKSLFDSCKTTREQGDIGLGYAIAELTAKGYAVSIPLTDNNYYDLVIELNGELKTVQVKTTKRKSYGHYEVQLRSIRPNKNKNVIRRLDRCLDYLFVVTDDKECFFIPRSEITQNSTITITERLSMYKL